MSAVELYACVHEDFAACVKVARISDESGAVRNFVAEVDVRCSQCDAPFHFLGPDTGFSFDRPMVNVPATTLHAPIAVGERPLPSGLRISFEMPGAGS